SSILLLRRLALPPLFPYTTLFRSLCRDHVRRLRRAEHLRGPRGVGMRGRVPLAVEDVLHDGLAARLGGGAGGAHRRAGPRKELRRYRRVPRRADGGCGRAAAGGAAGARARRAVSRAAWRAAAG